MSVLSTKMAEIKETELFKGFTGEEIKTLLERINASVKHFVRGDYIFLMGDAVEFICVVLQGLVQLVREDEEGNKSIVGNVNEGETFGENFLGAADNRTNVNYVAIHNSDILFLPFDNLTGATIGNLELHNKLFNNIVGVIAKQNNQLIEKVDILGKRSLRSKIMAYLKREARVSKSLKFELPFSRTDMASYLDADRSALTRELSKMQRDGLICFEKKIFTLLQMEKCW